MMLYVNGDSHTAGAEAVNPCAFAEDDPALYYLGRLPHPENLEVTWGKQLSLTLRSAFRCDAESGGGNDRIMRTTRKWLSENQRMDPNLLVIIQWSTWEREEWLHNDTYYQIGASGTDDVPMDLIDRYKKFVTEVDWREKTVEAHEKIWQFHQELAEQNIAHIFFNGNNDFSYIQDRRDWGRNYIGPYDSKLTYDAIIRSKGIDTVMPGSWHFGRDGHSAFHRYILQYIIDNQFV